MRRVLASLLIAAALASAAGAQTSKRTRIVTPPAAPAPADTPALPPPLVPLTGAAQSRDPDQCRSSCNRTYYFCRANGDDDTCPTSWAQCKARCTATYAPRPLGG